MKRSFLIPTLLKVGLALGLAPVGLASEDPAPGGPPELLAIRTPLAETVSAGPLEYAVLLVEGGKIVAIGPDLPVERGIRTIDLPEGWVVMPGLVLAYTRIGLDGEGYNGSHPEVLASAELYPAADEYDKVVEAGVTTMAQYPAGNDIPCQAVAIRPVGETAEAMILRDKVYLKIVLRANASSKKNISGGFEKLDKFLEKEAKNREKWEKDQEKKKKKKKDDDKKKKDDDEEKKNGSSFDDEDSKKEEEGSDEYVPLVPDPDVKAFLELREGTLNALVSIEGAGEYLHLLDAVGKEEFHWDLRIPLSREADLFQITDKLAEKGCKIVLDPTLTLHPGTMRQRNLPAEFARAGIDLVFVPRYDAVWGVESWLRDIGETVATGLDRQKALRALTLAPAELLGLGDRLGSLDEGKDANLILLDGDPFETSTRIKAVMIDGRFVFDEVKL
jgi:hypothetical protein